MKSISLDIKTGCETPKANDESKKDTNEAKEIYFYILYLLKEEEKEFIFTKYETEPKKIYAKVIKGENGKYLYEKVFKITKNQKKKEEKKK